MYVWIDITDSTSVGKAAKVEVDPCSTDVCEFKAGENVTLNITFTPSNKFNTCTVELTCTSHPTSISQFTVYLVCSVVCSFVCPCSHQLLFYLKFCLVSLAHGYFLPPSAPISLQVFMSEVWSLRWRGKFRLSHLGEFHSQTLMLAWTPDWHVLWQPRDQSPTIPLSQSHRTCHMLVVQ